MDALRQNSHVGSVCLLALSSFKPQIHLPALHWSASPTPPQAAWAALELTASSARLEQGHSSQWCRRLNAQPTPAPGLLQPHSPSLISTSNPGGKLSAHPFPQEIRVFQTQSDENRSVQVTRNQSTSFWPLRKRNMQPLVYLARLGPEDRVDNKYRAVLISLLPTISRSVCLGG